MSATTEYGVAVVIPAVSKKSISWWRVLASRQLEELVKRDGRRVHGAIRTRLDRGAVARMIAACDTRPESRE